MGDSIETSRDAIGDSDCDRIMRAGTRMRRTGSVNSISDSGRPFTGRNVSLDKSVRKWSACFRAGRESVGDAQRQSQANTIITSDLIDKVDDLVRSDRRVRLRRRRRWMSAMEPCGQLFTTCCDFGRCVPLGFRSNSPTSKRNCVWD
ncbi:hypothetical protein TNIN_238951 [Trichonephila inaurata madagascariensis]|uniref:Uncharacterized protein n=1 Tax=Trichonephila inaurata madagascariensis TaxID=2747483 RepID=A0A8X6X8H0_9ARAC|nr:hypothetical protein TNIN_238951 [Trichonephila inaurata madagascariensis]